MTCYLQLEWLLSKGQKISVDKNLPRGDPLACYWWAYKLVQILTTAYNILQQCGGSLKVQLPPNGATLLLGHENCVYRPLHPASTTARLWDQQNCSRVMSGYRNCGPHPQWDTVHGGIKILSFVTLCMESTSPSHRNRE
jgi:hypothetical protein